MKSYVSRKTFVGKMIVSQLILSLLAIMLSMSTGGVSGVIPAVTYITAFLSLGFYLYYFYTAFWQQGQQDAFIKAGKNARSPLTAAGISALVSIPAFIISLVCFITSYIPSMKAVFALGGFLNYVVHGMYCGITACDGIYGSYFWHEDVAWLYLFALLPGFFASFWGYLFGARSIRIGTIFGMNPPEDKRD